MEYYYDGTTQEICIECKQGWKDIYEPIVNYISEFNKTHQDQIAILQIKEKFGGIRIYCSSYNEVLRGLIKLAETASYHTCEYCGKPGGCKALHGWYFTLCPTCWELQEMRAQMISSVDLNADVQEARWGTKELDIVTCTLRKTADASWEFSNFMVLDKYSSHKKYLIDTLVSRVKYSAKMKYFIKYGVPESGFNFEIKE